MKSAQPDHFVHDRLPPPEGWPMLRYDLPELQIPDQANLVHASDSLETAEKEVPCFFSQAELFDYDFLHLPYLYTRKEREG